MSSLYNNNLLLVFKFGAFSMKNWTFLILSPPLNPYNFNPILNLDKRWPNLGKLEIHKKFTYFGLTKEAPK